MPDLPTLVNLGAFGIVLLAAGMFFTRMVWPFIVKRVEMNDRIVEGLQAEVRVARSQFLEALQAHDDRLAGTLKQVATDLAVTLEARDRVLAVELDKRDGELAKAIRELRQAIRPPGAQR